MTNHDRLFKELITTFFVEFIELFFPEVRGYLEVASIEFLDKEVWTDVPAGLLRQPDAIARVQTHEGQSEVLLIHIEVQTKRQKNFGDRMVEYFMLLRLRFQLPVFPVVIYLQRGSGGLGVENYQESVLGVPVLSFFYQRIGVPDLPASDYLKSDNPLPRLWPR